MIRRAAALPLGCFLLIAAIAPGAYGEEPATPAKTPKSDPVKLVINWDGINIWYSQLKIAQGNHQALDGPSVKNILERAIDEHAKAQIDRIVHVVWERCATPLPGFKSAPFDDFYYQATAGLDKFHQAGYDQVQVMLDRCREHNIQFLACLRTNDRHDIAQQAKFYLEHPEWRLEGYAGGLDYKYEGVRSYVLAFIVEFLDRYDVDGIELDYMRHCHVFRPSEAGENAPILTEFMRETRKLLDLAARKRGRDRLLLSVRVPQTLAECRSLGFDVPGWIQEGLVDCICPSDFFYTDFNIRVEDFVELTKGTPCRVYPTIHPLIAEHHPENIESANYRAAAQNYYAFGAHGISTYNYHYNWRRWIGGTRGLVDGWPKTFSYMTQLRDPKAIAQRSRHYLYYPLFSPSSPTGAIKHDKIVLDRGKEGSEGSLRFRMAEDLRDARLSAMLQFKVVGMADGDELEVKINGTKVAADQITRRDDADGQSNKEGRPLPAYSLYRTKLLCPPSTCGDNQLSVRLIKSAGKQQIEIQEVEVTVAVNETATGISPEQTRRDAESTATGAALAADTAEDSVMKAQRKNAARRQRRIIYNNDGADIFSAGGTVQGFLAARMEHAVGTQVDSINYNTGGTGIFHARLPRVGDMYGKDLIALRDAGHDPLNLIIDFCRRHDLEIIYSARMNDVHDSFHPDLLSSFKKEHPEYCMGRPEDLKRPDHEVRRYWSSLDYEIPQVRDYVFALIEDACTRYDLDGIELDWLRHPKFFRPTQDLEPAEARHVQIMNDFVRRVRAMTQRVGQQRGRPLLVACRVPLSLERALFLGLDLKTWLVEDLADILIGGGGYVPMAMTAQLRDMVQWGHRYGVPVYGCISASRMKQEQAGIEAWRAAAMNIWHAGADGVYTFNYFPSSRKLVFDQLGSVQTLSGLDKLYAIDSIEMGTFGGYQTPGMVVPDRLPLSVAPGRAVCARLPVGENIVAGTPVGKTCRARLRLRLTNLAAQERVDVAFNDHPLALSAASIRAQSPPDGTNGASWIEAPLDPAIVREGDNRIDISLASRHGESKPLTVDRLNLIVRYE